MSLTMKMYAQGRVSVSRIDALAGLRELPDNFVDSIVTDPPYNLTSDGHAGFMGLDWDGHGTPKQFQKWVQAWGEESRRVLKPGGHLVSFGSPRTWHRLTSGLEDAGYEIRDSIAWLNAEGMPKGQNVVREIKKILGSDDPAVEKWKGWATALKSSHEPIVVCRNPLSESTAARNILRYGTGAMNIDATRIPTSSESTEQGRWPANVVLDEQAAEELDAQSGVRTSGKAAKGGHQRYAISGVGIYGGGKGLWSESGSAGTLYGDSGGASRFYYMAKATKAERPVVDGVFHETVKPLELMRWLTKLVTPENGVVLDMFAGSGTIAEACLLDGFRAVLFEREEKYLPLIEYRIERALAKVA